MVRQHEVKLIKPKADGSVKISEPHFWSFCMTTVNDHEIEDQLVEVNMKILNAFSTYQKRRKWLGPTVSKILHHNLHAAHYKPSRGSSYLPFPNS